MRNKLFFFITALSLISITCSAKPLEKGPYTLKKLADNVYNIEDANDSNPAGIVTGDDGQIVHMNNSSDMYIILGSKKAMLIDLSNDVKWDKTAEKSLRSIVYDLAGDRQLIITFTHKHGDHLGMLPAFKDDPAARFLVPEEEFRGTDIFPKKRTGYFPLHASIDLGGDVVINTTELPGHTDHSTIFIIKDKNIAFTGDAVGSGSGVWLFNRQSFNAYIKGLKNFIEYINTPYIDKDSLIMYGGHRWQEEKSGILKMQYLNDMVSLIERMGIGTAESEKMSAAFPFLDTNFTYGTATITWNKEAADEYAESAAAKMGFFTRISKLKDYGMTITRLVVDLGEESSVSAEDISEGIFQVTGLGKTNTKNPNIKKLSVTDKRGFEKNAGRYVTIDLDFGFDSDPTNAYTYIVTLNKDLGKNKKGKKFKQYGRTLRR